MKKRTENVIQLPKYPSFIAFVRGVQVIARIIFDGSTKSIKEIFNKL